MAGTSNPQPVVRAPATGIASAMHSRHAVEPLRAIRHAARTRARNCCICSRSRSDCCDRPFPSPNTSPAEAPTTPEASVRPTIAVVTSCVPDAAWPLLFAISCVVALCCSMAPAMPVATRSSRRGRRWTFSYMFAGRQRELAIRKYPTMSLADARAKRAELREAKHRGLDPRAFWLEQPSQTARSRSAKIYSRSSPTCAASGRRAI